MTTESAPLAVREPVRRAAGRGQTRILLMVSGAISGGFGVGAAVQTTIFYLLHEHIDHPDILLEQLVIRLSANLAAVAFALLVMAVLRIAQHSRWRLVLDILIVSVVGAIAWVSLERLLGLELISDFVTTATEFGLGFLVVALGASFGTVFSQAILRLRTEETRSFTQASRAAAALAALQSEELRVRRDVAEGLHGSVQQRLVLVGARIDEIVRQITEGSSRNEAIAGLIGLRADLDNLREVDVREMSQMLYPDGLEVGLAQAVRIMMRRVPSTIAVDLSIAHEISELDSYDGRLDEQQRLNLIRIVEEGVSNALRHGHASRLRVRLEYVDGVIRVMVEDDGSGLPPATRLGGLGLLEHRLELQGGGLELDPSPNLGGARHRAELPTKPVQIAVLDAEADPAGQPGV